MSAAIQLVNQPSFVNSNIASNQLTTDPVSNHLMTAPAASNLVEGKFNNISRFEIAPEQRLRRAVEYIAELQAEVRSLREELARSERVSANYELLLRNAMVREQELRAQLVQGRY